MEDDGYGYTRTSHGRYCPVKTTKTTSFAEGGGNYFVMGVGTKRTFCPHLPAATEHAQHLIASGTQDEFLIVKVVGRIKRKLPEVEFTPIS